MGRFASFNFSLIIRGTHGWHLPKETAKDWKSFEKSVYSACLSLEAYLFHQVHDIHHIFTRPVRPSQLGYFTVHPSADTALRKVQDSIDGFVIYTAYLSFLIILCRTITVQGFTLPSTEDIFQMARADAHPHWVQSLLSSGIGDIAPSRRRVGVVIEVKTCEWLSIVPHMIRAGIPLWFYWGDPPYDFYHNSWLSMFSPFSSATSSAQIPQLRHPPIIDGFPPLPLHSRQLQGETMKAFFERQEKIRAETLLKENSRDKQRRQQRENQHLAKQCPGANGPTVFRWEKVDGHRIRVQVSRNEASEWWSYYKSSQMKYNSILNQWDIGTDIEDGDDRDMMDSEDETDSVHSTWLPAKDAMKGRGDSRAMTRSPPQIMENHERSSSSSPRLLSSTSRLNTMGKDEEFIDANDSGGLSTTSKINVMSDDPILPQNHATIPRQYVEDLVYYRYGYSLSEWPYRSIFAGWEKVKPIAGSWLGVCRAIGAQSHETESEENCTPIRDFLSILLESKRAIHEVPYIYWDISPASRAPLKARLSTFNVHVEVLPFKDETLCLLHPLWIGRTSSPSLDYCRPCTDSIGMPSSRLGSGSL